jgi:peptidoglycan hydrolase-like protein with peptidoglycan-binding domain
MVTCARAGCASVAQDAYPGEVQMLPTTLRDGAYVPKRVKEEIDFDGPIERGAKKMRAQRVQEFLTLNGFAVSIDGDFGPATEKRLRDFQTARGLPATGVVDMKTHEELVAPIVKALNPIAAGERASPPSPRPTPSNTSRTTQKRLAATIGAPGSGAISIGTERTQDGAPASSALRSSRRPTRSASTFRSTPHRPAMCWRWKPRRPESSCQNRR